MPLRETHGLTGLAELLEIQPSPTEKSLKYFTELEGNFYDCLCVCVN